VEWHFGYNCRHFVPTLGKCRVLIERYNRRADLLAQKKELKARDILVYSDWSPKELLARVDRGEVQARKLKKSSSAGKDGSWRFQLRCSWGWDDCALQGCGGQCIHFEAHDGEKITCLMELRHLGAEHPNMAKVPSDEDVRLVEDGLSDRLAQGWSALNAT